MPPAQRCLYASHTAVTLSPGLCPPRRLCPSRRLGPSPRVCPSLRPCPSPESGHDPVSVHRQEAVHPHGAVHSPRRLSVAPKSVHRQERPAHVYRPSSTAILSAAASRCGMPVSANETPPSSRPAPQPPAHEPMDCHAVLELQKQQPRQQQGPASVPVAVGRQSFHRPAESKTATAKTGTPQSCRPERSSSRSRLRPHPCRTVPRPTIYGTHTTLGWDMAAVMTSQGEQQYSKKWCHY